MVDKQTITFQNCPKLLQKIASVRFSKSETADYLLFIC